MTIDGGSGNDVIWSSSGNDILDGGEGNDILFGGLGDDTLTGGTGADIFEFATGSANDTIKDYNKSDGDQIKFYIQSGEPNSITIQNSSTIKWGNSLIELENVDLQSLSDLNTVFFDL